MGLGFVKHFTVKSHFICIDEATSSNMFLLNSLHLLIYVHVNSSVIVKNIFFYNHMSISLLLYTDLNKFWKTICGSILNYCNKYTSFETEINELHMLGSSRHAWPASFSI
jgi:hypothetical protein